MSEINYIKHLNGVYQRISEDENLNTSHVSLYMALFQFWNLNRFKNPFFINRSEVMRISKIGSKNTYHKCIKELSKWKYIKYAPTQNPFKSSEVSLYNYGTSTVPNGIKSGTSTEQVLYQLGTKKGTSTGILYKHNKHINNSKQEPQISDFLKVKKDKNYNEPL